MEIVTHTAEAIALGVGGLAALLALLAAASLSRIRSAWTNSRGICPA